MLIPNLYGDKNTSAKIFGENIILQAYRLFLPVLFERQNTPVAYIADITWETLKLAQLQSALSQDSSRVTLEQRKTRFL